MGGSQLRIVIVARGGCGGSIHESMVLGFCYSALCIAIAVVAAAASAIATLVAVASAAAVAAVAATIIASITSALWH